MLRNKSTMLLWQNFSRSLGSIWQLSTKDLRVSLEEKMKAMYQQEQQHQFLVNKASYSEAIELSKDEFVKMMLLDGCFIIELFRDLNMNNFAYSSLLSKRWMLPVVRFDIITLENQLLMIVLRKLFTMTRRKSTPEPLLEELALCFFDPLMPRSLDIRRQSIKSTIESSIEGSHPHDFKHLLDLFHSSISLGKVKQCKEPHMY
ncbi:hypothetical protein Cgig2_019250 [Carnegiea gigantea]|uniref:Uncharacterized protein n=1 Tax=Carnegiea gigantea TaxID=171969 RepID=A0A9Q1KPJ1_9CARY|nr:hypothetical protein Cgig2_019250 [Carnegiea gigantea]